MQPPFLASPESGFIDVAVGLPTAPCAAREVAPAKLSSNQERFWWIEMVGRHVPVYNCPMGLRIDGVLDVPKLQAAVDRLADRHESLRAQVTEIDGDACQTVVAPGQLVNLLQLVDLSAYPQERREDVLDELIKHDLAQFFDLASAPLWRLMLFRLDEERFHLHLNIHHVISDAWSIGVFFRDLSALYSGGSEEQGLPALAPLDPHRAQPSPSERKASEAHWLNAMQGPLPTLQLPEDHPRPQHATFRGAGWQWKLDPETTTRLKQGAVERGATLYMAILTAYSVFLNRLSGQTDLVIGTMFSGRKSTADWPRIGCFANTVALRLGVNPDATYEQLLHVVRADVLSAHTHQYYPLQDLVARLAVEREAGRSVLFSTLLIFQNTMGDFESLFPGLHVRADYEEQHRSAAECDLFMQVRERDGGLQLNFEYSAELFDSSTIARFADQFDAVVLAMTRDWKLPVRASDTLPETQRELLINRWNSTEAEYPLDDNIVVRFERQVAQQPDAMAIECDGVATTYAQLHDRARIMGSVLVERGFGPGDIVGIYHRRSVDLVVAMLGTLMAGCAYLPLDPKYPDARVALMLREARARALITQSELRDKVPSTEHELAVFCTDRLPSPMRAVDDVLPSASSLAGESLAYVIFTSGSTGTPKGAAIEHRSLANLLSWAQERLGTRALTRLMATSSVCFDSSVFEIFSPLATGGTVVLLDSALHVGTVSLQGVTLSCAPSVATQLLLSDSMPRGLRTVVLAGEPVAESLVRKLYALEHVEAVYNLYGLSESAVYSTWALLQSDGPTPPPIGIPIANTRIYLLDSDRRPVPIGATGEIYIGGVGLGREYLNRPELTRERFLADPFRPSERICRTGDLGRFNAEGSLVCLGRIDHQVKIRGFRIELGEVEDALSSHPQVRSSVVVAAEVAGTGRCLVGYYVTSGADVGGAVLRAHLQTRLPDYMVPSYLVQLPEIPLNGSGKVDRSALPTPLQQNTKPEPAQAAVFARPDQVAHAVEQEVVSIWQEALQRDHIDVDAKLFEIGGHSLLLPQLRQSLLTRLQVEVPLTQFFVCPTVRDLVAYLTSQHSDALSRLFLTGAGTEVNPNATPASTVPRAIEPGSTVGSDARDLAVIGFSCRVPGASSPEAFWNNLLDGVDAITEVSPERWDWRSAEQGGHGDGLPHCRWGGWLEGVHDFDPEFFRLSAREARWMDPQQRLLMEVAWEACERAGYRPGDLGGGRVGVFVGASFQDYVRTLEQAGVLSDSYAGSGNALSMLANRLSYRFGYVGPSLTIDTACSSSLVALHMAGQALRAGEADVAMVAGVSLMLTPENMTIWGQSGMLSADGRCKAFDVSANGFVPGEGVVVMLLKPLSCARRDGDQIWAVLRGSAVNHDGDSKMGLTVPNPKAQREVVRAALLNAGVTADSLTLLEAHGTGTPLGDPVEVQGLTEAFRDSTERSSYCALSSTKSAIGHLGPAAGLASAVKAVLCLHHGEIPANLHLVQPNPELCLEQSPFYLSDVRHPWPVTDGPRRAGISAFGFGGANAHAVFEEAGSAQIPSDTREEHLFTASARSQSALRALVVLYCKAIASDPTMSLADLCFTVNSGREPWQHRVAVMAGSIEQLAERLGLWLDAPEDAHLDTSKVYAAPARTVADLATALRRDLDERQRGLLRQICRGGEQIRAALGSADIECTMPDRIQDADWPSLLPWIGRIFVLGAQVDWAVLYASGHHRRVLLPTYPFERRPCSIDRPISAGVSQAAPMSGNPATDADPWMHRILWTEQAAATPGALLRGIWLVVVLGDEDAYRQAVLERTRSASGRTIVVRAAERFVRTKHDEFTINPRHGEDYERVLKTLREEGVPVSNIVHLGPSGQLDSARHTIDEVEAEHDLGVRSLLLLSQAIARQWNHADIGLRVVTHRAVTTGEGDDAVVPARATAWGLAKVVARENHRVRIQCIDADGSDANGLVAELANPIREEEVALRRSRRFVPTIRAMSPSEFGKSTPLRQGGVYVITGAAGGIGRVLARWLGERYQANMVLVGRSAPQASVAAALVADISSIAAAGGSARWITADVAQRDQFRRVVETTIAEHGTIHGVFHLAGKNGHERLATRSMADFDAVLRAKVHGACVIDSETADLPLDFLVLFSSLAALFGNVFQADYSAANRFLDAFASWRNAQGRRTISMNWGGWSEVGMGLALGNDVAGTADLVSPQHGMDLLARAMHGSLSQIVLGKADAQAAGRQSTVQIETSNPAENRERAIAFLCKTLAEVLQVPEHLLELQTPFLDLGVDSINSAWLVAAINAATGTTQRRTLFFDYPTIEKLATALAALPFPEQTEALAMSSPILGESEQRAAKVSISEERAAASEAIAIVGMAGRFPGVSNLQEFWQQLREGRESMGPAPLARWGGHTGSDGFLRSMRGGFFDQLDEFDPKLFNISPLEAEAMEPQQRMLLEVAYQAMEDAGYTAAQLAECGTGVFIGASASPVADAGDFPELGPHTLVGNSVAILANRLSYFLDLNGPSMTVDTLCSSSLAAVHVAVQSLRRGECATAIVGGIRVGMPARYYEAAYRVGALSASGQCRAFDRHADGMVPGEGAGIIVLKPLSAAQADGDHIHAVILGSALNHGGRSSGLAAPNASAQARVVRAALADAQVGAQTIGLIEAHGTGTELGDPIEVDGLCQAFEQDTRNRQFCAIGSVKTNIGHLEPAAGIAGLIKAVLSLSHGEIAPSLNVLEPNPTITFEHSPFYLNDRLTPWTAEDGMPRRAGVSAFGIGGVNAHVVLEEAPVSSERHDGERRSHLITLSARTPEALRAQAAALSTALAGSGNTHSVMDTAFTLANGRARWPHRLALVCDRHDTLVAGLSTAALGSTSAGLSIGYAERGRKPKVAFLFSGQSADLRRAGATLFQTEPVFSAALRHCDDRLRDRCGLSILEALYPLDGDDSRLDEARYAQPALFALGYAMARLWRSRGVEPTAVLGHSLGEYAAAVTAGALELDDALDLVATRAQLMQAKCGQGGMLAIMLDPDQVRVAISPWSSELEIAVVNGPANTVVSGTHMALKALEQELESRGIVVHRLSVTHAFHSALMDPMLEDFSAAASRIVPKSARLSFASSQQGRLLDRNTRLDAEYWSAHLRRPVLYADALQALVAEGYTCFVEFGASDVLCRLGPQIAPDEDLFWCPTLKRGRDDRELQLHGLGALYVRGAQVDLSMLYPARSGRRIPLPGSHFERRKLIQTASMATTAATQENSMQMPSVHGGDQTAAAPVASRIPALVAILRGIFADALHIETSEVDPNVPLLELGADSLALGGVTRVLRQRFDIRLATRQLFAELSTISAVAVLLDQHLAPGFALEPCGASPPVSAGRATQAQVGTHLTQPPRIEPAIPALATGIAARQTTPSIQGSAASIELAASKPYIPFQPFRPRANDAVGEGDSSYTRDFVNRYVERTGRSKEFAARHRSVLADSRGTTGFRLSIKEMLYPVVGQRSAGARVWDLDGNEYVDISMGYGVHLFGHGAPFIQEAITRQLEQGVQVGPQAQHAGEVAELLCELTGSERVAFCNSGTEANMLALRLARTATGRPKVAIFEGCYHGFYDSTLVVADRGAGGRIEAAAMAPGLPPTIANDVLVLPYGTDEALSIIRAHAHELAAVLVEPVQSRRPTVQPVEFLRELRALTAQAGITLIFDEVITGFRVHPGGAQAAFGIRADLAVYGKIVGGGLPIGVVAGKASLMDGVDGGDWRYGDDSYPMAEQTFFATTFGKHPLVMATAAAALREIKSQGAALHTGLTQKTDALMARLNAVFDHHGVDIRAQNFSSQFRFVSPGNIDLFYYHLTMHGIYVWEGRNFFLSTAHRDADINQLVHAVDASLSEMIANKLLPTRAAALAPAASPARPVRIAPSPREFPLSHIQREILVSTQLGGKDSASYNEPLAIVLKGALDASALCAAYQRVIDRHDVLRCVPDTDLQLQRTTDVEASIPMTDLSACERTVLSATLASQMQRAAAQPFDFVHGPMIRAQLWRLAPDQHALLLTLHHSVADATSFGVILQELCAFYAEEVGEGAAQFAPAMQYEELVHAWGQPDKLAEREDAQRYWLSQFEDGAPVLALATDRRVPDVPTDRGARVRLAMGAPLSRAIARIAAEAGSTPFVVLFAAFNVWLYRLTGQNDLVAGVPASRHPGEASGLVGHCINMLPVRSRLNPDTSFVDLIQQTKDRVLDAYDHVAMPFAELVRCLDLGKEARRSPLVRAQFNMDPATSNPSFAGLGTEFISLNEPMSPLDLSDLGAGAVEFDTGIAKFDLSLSMHMSDDDLRGLLEYRTDLFDRATIEAWIESFQTLLEEVMADSRQPIGMLGLVNSEQRRRLRDPHPTSLSELGRPTTLHESFSAQARRVSQAVAIISETEVLSYGELEQRANRLADRLRAQGVAVESLVGICLKPSVQLAVATLAVLKAGGAYVWLDPDNAEQLRVAMASGLRLIVTPDGSPAVAGGREVESVSVHADANTEASAASSAAADFQVDPDNLASMVMLHENGLWRGVLRSHRSVMRMIDATRQQVEIDESDVWSMAQALASNDQEREFWGALANGARLAIAPAQASASATELHTHLCRQGVTIFVCPSATFRELAKAAIAAPPSCRWALRVLAVGDGALASTELSAWFERFGDRNPRILQLYGTVECAGDVIAQLEVSTLRQTAASHMTGSTLPDAECFVLDSQGQPLPFGAVGELWVANEALARGYHGDAAATAERFVPNPYSLAIGGRLFRTGQRARRRSDGSIETLGRTHEVPSATGAGAGPSAARLPAAPPSTQAELIVAEAWTAILKVEVTDVGDDFFDLGGDSLLAIRVTSRLSKKHGVKVTMRDLFETSTLAQFARVVEVLLDNVSVPTVGVEML